jgi:hypothetical protein
MNIESITENIESVIGCAEAIKTELENSDDSEAIQLYETLEGNGVTTDADEIVAAVELVAELSTDDPAEINSALELWESVNSNGHDTDDIEDALSVYAIVENSSVCTSELEGSLNLVDEWNEHCAHAWADPETMTAAYEELSNIVEVFSTAFGDPIYGVDDANEAVRVLGNRSGVSDEERALLDAISALCAKQAGTNAVPSAVKVGGPGKTDEEMKAFREEAIRHAMNFANTTKEQA